MSDADRTRTPWVAWAAPAAILAIDTRVALANTPFVGVTGADFRAFWTSGVLLVQGANPYTPPVGTLPNLNPPIWLPAFALLSHVNPVLGYCVWAVLSLALFTGLLALGLHRWHPRRPVFVASWLLASYPLWETITVGQVYVLVAVLVLGAFALWPRHPVVTGVLIGATIALKPNLAVWPVLLALDGDLGSGLLAVLVALIMSATSVLWYGPATLGSWLTAARDYDGVASLINGSLAGLAYQVKMPGAAVFGSVLLLLGSAAIVHLRRPGFFGTSSLAVLAGLLAAPVAWPGYLLLLLPMFLAWTWDGPWLGLVALTVLPNVVLGLLPAVGLLYPTIYLLLYARVVWRCCTRRPPITTAPLGHHLVRTSNSDSAASGSRR
ncbi:MAG TPA: glycosyltransferase family 87 protein [Chloroflexota bacterium]|nr:glycosyltransferase family 87 protein [Chloroflexota bacterium]